MSYLGNVYDEDVEVTEQDLVEVKASFKSETKEKTKPFSPEPLSHPFRGYPYDYKNVYDIEEMENRLVANENLLRHPRTSDIIIGCTYQKRMYPRSLSHKEQRKGRRLHNHAFPCVAYKSKQNRRASVQIVKTYGVSEPLIIEGTERIGKREQTYRTVWQERRHNYLATKGKASFEYYETLTALAEIGLAKKFGCPRN